MKVKMTDSANETKTLQMLVKNEWVVDSISSLGSGYFSFLVYQVGEIAPEVLTDLRDRLISVDAPGEIIQVKEGSGRRVATVNLKKVADFQEFVRVEFMILSVIPFLRGGWQSSPTGYQCFYRPDPV
jgi:hypothetical protein